jgi:hypothetical protein
MAAFDDGTGPALYVGGLFNIAGGMPIDGIARWNGASWSQVGTGLSVNGLVYGMTVANVGGVKALYITGGFSQAGGQTVNNVACWHSGAWHALGTAPDIGLSSGGYALTSYDADGPGPQPLKLIVGGLMPKAGPVTVNGIAAWDGTSWSALGNGIPLGSAHHVSALAVHDEGQGPALFVAGAFPSVDGAAVPAVNIARWKSSTWSTVGGGFNEEGFALAVHDDGSGPALHAGGKFTLSGATPVRYAARWNGSTWEQLGHGIDTNNGWVFALCNFTDAIGPALCVGGNFTSVNSGRSAGRIALWRGTTSALRYCTAKVNSLGCTPAISWTGSASATATSGFVVKAAQVRNNKSGLLFYSMAGRTVLTFQGGKLCVKVPIRRTPPVSAGGSAPPVNDCSGVFAIDMNAFARGLLGGTPDPALSIPGTLADAQWWGRDPGFPAPNNTTLSDAVEFAVCP